MTFRNIHSLACYSLEGLSQWAARELRSWLHTRCHLLKDTRQFVKLISTKCAKPDETLYRLDAKEFFMSGRHPELIEAGIANLPEGRRRDCLRRVLEFLFDNQYVKSGALPERLWKVEERSGMGLAHSGDLCDAALDSLAESWSTDPVVLREHGVRLYVRFRDDIFFIGSDRRLSVSYVQELRRRAKFFHIIAECPSDSEAQFLEVKVWKSGTRYHTVPCPKPTSLGIPLDVTSAHPPRVHLSWPVGTISRVQGLSTHREHAVSAKALVNRFRRRHAPSFLIELLNRTPAWHSNFGPIPSCKSGVLWLPLGFHPTLHRTLSKAVAELTKSVQWQQLYSMAFGVACPCVRLSWYHALRSQAFVIKQLGRRQG